MCTENTGDTPITAFLPRLRGVVGGLVLGFDLCPLRYLYASPFSLLNMLQALASPTDVMGTEEFEVKFPV